MPSWATPWRPRRRPPERRGPRIAVVGNCQAEGTAQALRLMLPDARVETHAIAHLARRFGDLDGLVRHLGEVEHVFSHFFPESFLPGGDVLALQRRVARLRLFPTIAFPAFHPDMIQVGDVASLRMSRLVRGPLGPYHSAIALYGHLEGLDARATLTLYTDAVFERLGYYRLWEEGAADLLRVSRDMQFGLDRELAHWARRGCFMNDAHHPKLHVLGDLARRLALESGLAPLPVRVEDYLPDTLVDEAMWPVHPAVAARYGVAAQGLFRGRPPTGRPPRLLDLPRFVAESLALYARLPRDELVAARIAAWRADAGIGALFASARGA